MIKNYYKILNLNKNSSKQEIKNSYRKLVKFWHPDVNSNPRANDKIIEINEAYEILYDDIKRATYDKLYEHFFEINHQEKANKNQYETYQSESKSSKGQKISINIEIDLAELEKWIQSAKVTANSILKKGIKKVDSGLETGFYAVGQVGNCLSVVFGIAIGIAFLVSPLKYFGKLLGGQEESSIWRILISIIFGGLGILIIVGLLKNGLNQDDD
jgi:hypothetical protein